ncbi:MAG: glucans biosynthesis glucosyltransferase MdoH [Pseudomonadota bacterium]|uniref:glucans biosynthesis glucosyltransferase MdoH n=1 Tax=Hyphomonas sp. BRH_c22 TaxID=1629710 RepID=UPI0026131232|nr:glucans biosynthesis glucosyltransferase MdoH [Hyphomonas sp. BRH_c22]
MMLTFRARPAELPISMPDQAFDTGPTRNAKAPKSFRWRKVMVFSLSLALAVWATVEMYHVLDVSGVTTLEKILLGVFSLNISWIAYAFVSATIGFLAALAGLFNAHRSRASSGSALISGRTVIVFPIYNEEVERVFATVESTAESLTNAPGRFECFILSDTNDPEIALQEEAAFERLRSRLAPGSVVHYRRRTMNLHRKAGNIRDFITRWGGRYDYMIVFDADSFMERDTLIELARRMDASPETGLIQTIPQLVGGRTLFARTQQFAAALYGPVLGSGLAWWAQNEGNFWGHNAILRISALANAAGLPEIPGRAPFGGSILSHDFVEAALLRRAGWNVQIAPELGGSYEQGPPSIIDLSIRDRRWCQGNMQHMAVLLKTRGLTFTSRMHLIIGIFSYLASPLWLLFITVGMLLSLQNMFLKPQYFGESAALFPSWPVIDSERSLNLFLITMAILFAPKLYGLIYGLASPRWRRTVGPVKTFLSVIAETVISVLIAPVMLVEQTTAVYRVFSGRDGGWNPQARDSNEYTLHDTFRHHAPAIVLGTVLNVSAFAISPIFAAWLAPATIGMLLAATLSYWTGRTKSGDFARRMNLLESPEEIEPPQSYLESVADRPAYHNLDVPSLTHLFADRNLRNRRTHIVDTHWPLAHSEVHTPLALARARANRLATIDEYISALEPKEKLALLNSPGDLDAVIDEYSMRGLHYSTGTT